MGHVDTENASGENELDGDRIKPGATFYLKVGVWNADGTMSVVAEEGVGATRRHLVEQACIAETEEHGTENYIYECRAVAKVVRGKTKLINLKPSGR